MTSGSMFPPPQAVSHTPAARLGAVLAWLAAARAWLARLPVVGPYARRPRHAQHALRHTPDTLADEVIALRLRLSGRHERPRPLPVPVSIRLLLGAALAVAVLLLWAGIDGLAATPVADLVHVSELTGGVR